MVTRLLQALDTLAYSGMFIARFALAALLVLSLYAVVSRYVFNSASVHALEFSTYLLSMIAWLSLAWILREDRHVRMDALRDNLPTWLKRIANTISLTAIVIFST
ncbi:MAG: TRAP transporter small permease, partial [Gammaproteobacteria bacterium]|nr:TRAP transporter small permease [Gammaproteobacteria bacterium]